MAFIRLKFKDFFFQFKHLITLYLVWVFICLILLNSIGNVEFSVLINQYHHTYFDLFFKYITHFGDGIIAFAVILLLFFFRLDYGLISLVGFSISATTTQICKRFVFEDVQRPFVIFKEQVDLGQWHLVDGVEIHQLFSFPSGHTTSIFSICILLSLILNHKKYHYLLFVLAFLVGFSRIYLSQHFLIDVFVGSLIGSVVTLFSYLLLIDRLESLKKYSLLNN